MPNISCRICGNDHFTARCSLKDCELSLSQSQVCQKCGTIDHMARDCSSNCVNLGHRRYDCQLEDYCEHCRVNSCYNQANFNDLYCPNHQERCQALDCSGRRLNSEGYCFSHKNKCSVCQIRTSGNYCQSCQEKYLRCQALIESGLSKRKCLRETAIEEDYCSIHQYPCQQKDCLNRISKVEWERDSYCSKHQDRCQLNGCSGRILEQKEKFCSQHLKQWKCSRCQEEAQGRIKGQGEVVNRLCSWKDGFILAHNWECYGIIEDGLLQKCCLKCSNTVNNEQQYCWKHYYPCLECSDGRTSNYNSHCSSYCEKNKLQQLIQQSKKIPGKIADLERFKTWWSHENSATIITELNGSFWVFLGVIDRNPNSTGKIPASEIFVYPSYHSEIRWGIYAREKHDSHYSADAEASWLRTKLNSDNPILLIHPQANSWTSFTNILCDPYVRKNEIGIASSTHYGLFVVGRGWTPSNLDNHFKIGDIVWVEKRDIFIGKKYYHVGVVLGKDAICHISDPDALISEDNMKARITSWDGFLNKRTGELYRYHPIIPFKNYKKIIEQIVKSWHADYGLNKYDLYNDNCEHFANAVVLGIYYSEQIKDLEANHEVLEVLGKFKEGIFRAGRFYWDATKWLFTRERIKDYKKLITNNSKGLTICLRNELKSWDSNDRFDNLTSNELRKMRDRYEKEYEAKIEQPINIKDCIIM